MSSVNRLYFETMAKGDYTALPYTFEMSLREIAEKCPLRYGSAVGRAQSILSHYDKPFEPSEECKEINKHLEKADDDSSNDQLRSVEKDRTRHKIVISPNPVSDILRVTFISTIGESNKIQLLNTNGQLLQEKSTLNKQATFDVSTFTSGIYWVRIQTNKKSISKKIVIK